MVRVCNSLAIGAGKVFRKLSRRWVLKGEQEFAGQAPASWKEWFLNRVNAYYFPNLKLNCVLGAQHYPARTTQQAGSLCLLFRSQHLIARQVSVPSPSPLLELESWWPKVVWRCSWRSPDCGRHAVSEWFCRTQRACHCLGPGCSTGAAWRQMPGCSDSLQWAENTPLWLPFEWAVGAPGRPAAPFSDLLHKSCPRIGSIREDPAVLKEKKMYREL